jgi:hypothetical protein
MEAMNKTDATRFADIRRKAQYGATLKDLAWLISMVEKMDKQLAAAGSPVAAKIPPRADRRDERPRLS